MKHRGIQEDEAIKAQNIAAGNEICEECDGTGNMFYSMFKECTFCLGDGIAILPKESKK